MTNTTELDSLHSSLGEAERYAKELESKLADREWQPIETAPKDGSSILVFNGRAGAVHWDGSGWVGAVLSRTGPVYLANTPTHWMPLPPPPPST